MPGHSQWPDPPRSADATATSPTPFESHHSHSHAIRPPDRHGRVRAVRDCPSNVAICHRVVLCCETPVLENPDERSERRAGQTQSGNSRFCSLHRRKKNRADVRKTKKTHPKSTKTPPQKHKNTQKKTEKIPQKCFRACARNKTSCVKKILISHSTPRGMKPKKTLWTNVSWDRVPRGPSSTKGRIKAESECSQQARGVPWVARFQPCESAVRSRIATIRHAT